MSIQRDTATDTTNDSTDAVDLCLRCDHDGFNPGFDAGWEDGKTFGSRTTAYDFGFDAGMDAGKKKARKKAKKNGFLPTLTMYADPSYWADVDKETSSPLAYGVQIAAIELQNALEAADYITKADAE